VKKKQDEPAYYLRSAVPINQITGQYVQVHQVSTRKNKCR